MVRKLPSGLLLPEMWAYTVKLLEDLYKQRVYDFSHGTPLSERSWSWGMQDSFVLHVEMVPFSVYDWYTESGNLCREIDSLAWDDCCLELPR